MGALKELINNVGYRMKFALSIRVCVNFASPLSSKKATTAAVHVPHNSLEVFSWAKKMFFTLGQCLVGPMFSWRVRIFGGRGYLEGLCGRGYLAAEDIWEAVLLLKNNLNYYTSNEL